MISPRRRSFLHVLFIFQALISGTAAANPSDILYDISPFVRVYKNGTVERLTGTEVVPASVDPKTGVNSRDVNNTFERLTVSARIYLPGETRFGDKFPLLVCFHGGAFFTGSPYCPTYHNHMNALVARARVVAVSVDYRLAPENPLPIGYEDSWVALTWALSHCVGYADDPWLTNYVDCGRVYLGGDSAGGNIAHNMVIRAGVTPPFENGPVLMSGMFLNCPHFWGTKPVGNETSADPKRKALVESIWVHAYPNSTGFDDPSCNPALDPNLGKLAVEGVLVYVAEKDVLRDRGWYYAKALRNSTWGGSVEVVEVPGEDHVFNLRFPNSTRAEEMLERLASFLNQGKNVC